MQNYEDLEKIGTQKYKDNNFCAVIALSVATGISFRRVNRKLKKLGGRVHRRGTQPSAMLSFLKCYDVDYEWKHDIVVNRPTVGELVKLNPKGTFLLFQNGHVSAMVDGDLNDHTNPDRNERRKQYSKARVWQVLQITKKEQ